MHKKWSFRLRIASVNLTKSAGNCGYGYIYRGDNLHAFTEEILDGKPDFLCSANLSELIKLSENLEFFLWFEVEQKLINPFHANGLFRYLLKTSENLWFFDVLAGIEREQWHKMG